MFSTTIPLPLSACLMMMDLFSRSSLRASFSAFDRLLLELGWELLLLSSSLVFCMYSSSLVFDACGGCQVDGCLKGCFSWGGLFLKKCFIRMFRAILSKSSRSLSKELGLAVGANPRPFDSTDAAAFESVCEERLVMCLYGSGCLSL